MTFLRRLISASLGSALIVGSLLALPGTAHAALGDFTVAGTISLGIPVTVTAGTGTGTVSPGGQTSTTAGTWTGSFVATGFAAPGLPNCVGVALSTTAGNDVINWGAGVSPSATQVLHDAAMIIDTTGPCPLPAGRCRLVMEGDRTLASTSFPITSGGGKVRQGVFTAPAGTIVGWYHTEHVTPASCPPALVLRINTALGFPNMLMTRQNSTTAITASLTKTVQTIP